MLTYLTFIFDSATKNATVTNILCAVVKGTSSHYLTFFDVSV